MASWQCGVLVLGQLQKPNEDLHSLGQKRAFDLRRQTVNRINRDNCHLSGSAKCQADKIDTGNNQPCLVAVRRNSHDTAPAPQSSSNIQVTVAIKREALGPPKTLEESVDLAFGIYSPDTIK